MRRHPLHHREAKLHGLGAGQRESHPRHRFMKATVPSPGCHQGCAAGATDIIHAVALVAQLHGAGRAIGECGWPRAIRASRSASTAARLYAGSKIAPCSRLRDSFATGHQRPAVASRFPLSQFSTGIFGGGIWAVR